MALGWNQGTSGDICQNWWYAFLDVPGEEKAVQVLTLKRSKNCLPQKNLRVQTELSFRQDVLFMLRVFGRGVSSS